MVQSNSFQVRNLLLEFCPISINIPWLGYSTIASLCAGAITLECRLHVAVFEEGKRTTFYPGRAD